MKFKTMTEDERRIMRREATAILTNETSTHDERIAADAVLRYEATIRELEEDLAVLEARFDAQSEFLSGYMDGLDADWFEDEDATDAYID